jgi:D-glycero-D-manno-heptose 1,7-bisphosphate phosphatase
VKGVLLDRDGTLIDFHRDAELGAVVSAFHPDHVRFLPGVVTGLRALRDAGFVLGVASNQPGAAKGQIPREAIERTQRALVERLAAEGVVIAGVATCLHHPEGGPGGEADLVHACDCRKPAPGMLIALCHELGLDPAASWMIGDSSADVEAAHRAGMRAGLLLDTRRCELCPLKDAGAPLGAERVAARFDRLVEMILGD